MYDPTDDHGVFGAVRERSVGVMGGETVLVEGGRYGYYDYQDEDGSPRKYHWARRDTDYGHRNFATADEARRYAESGLG